MNWKERTVLRDEKWLSYSISILKAVHTGSASLSAIADDINGPKAYIAKIVALLKRSKLINNDYQLTKPPDNITIREVVEIANTCNANNDISNKILHIMLKALEVPITNVW